MGKSGIISTAAAGLDLPPDVVGGAVRLTMLGQQLVQVINHRGIVVYEPERIILRISDGRLQVKGDSLTLSELNDEQLTIEGHIVSLLFVEEDNEN